MKTLTKKLFSAAFAAVTIGTATETARAAKLTLDGSGYYKLGAYVDYAPRGKLQTGRYKNLGADYYHNAEIGVKRITNRSTKRSGTMSFELWAMPYYGATSGIVLMTNAIEPLKGGFNFQNVFTSGKAISLDRYRFPELDLFEYTSSGWTWRDVLVFPKKDLL